MIRSAPIILLLLSCSPTPSSSPLDDVIPRIMAEDHVPGAVVVVGSSEGVTYRNHFGTASMDTVFDLASLTKVVATTTAALILVDEGRLDLDSPVSRWLKPFQGRDVTLRNLLQHRSGLAPYLKPASTSCDEILAEIASFSGPKTYVYS